MAAGGVASMFTGGQRKPTWSEREMSALSARLMRGAAPMEAGRMASMADLLGGRESAMDVLRQTYGGNPIYTPSPLLGPIREGLYDEFDPGAVRSSPLYRAASENIRSEAGETERNILAALGARGALHSGTSQVQLETLGRGTDVLLNQAFMAVAETQRQERTNRINMALGLLTGDWSSGATQAAATAGSLAAGAREPAPAPSGGGFSDLGKTLMLREYLSSLNRPGATSFVPGMGLGSAKPGDYTNPFWWGDS